MAATDRMRRIELQVDRAVEEEADDVDDHRAASEEFERTKIPFEQLDLQIRRALDQPDHEGAEARRKHFAPRQVPPAPAMAQPDARIEIPADQEDALPGLEHRVLDESEIGGGIDHDVRSTGSGITPDRRACRLLLLLRAFHACVPLADRHSFTRPLQSRWGEPSLLSPVAWRGMLSTSARMPPGET